MGYRVEASSKTSTLSSLVEFLINLYVKRRSEREIIHKSCCFWLSLLCAFLWIVVWYCLMGDFWLRSKKRFWQFRFRSRNIHNSVPPYVYRSFFLCSFCWFNISTSFCFAAFAGYPKERKYFSFTVNIVKFSSRKNAWSENFWDCGHVQGSLKVAT